jgi:preprotein translocase subunit SecD
MKKVGGRLLALVTMVVASIIFFLPSYQPLYKELPRWVREVLPDKGITLGLDLQGGIHLVLEVEEDRAVEIAVERTAAGLQDLLVEKKIPAESVKRTGSSQITIGFQNAELKAQVQKMLDDFPTYVEVESAGSANKVVWELRDAEIKRIKDSAINQALETIRNRIDQFGVAEPLIQRQGLKQVVVQLPGIKDAKLAKDLIKQTALLEFKLLDDENQLKLDLPGRIQKGKEREDAFLKQVEGKVPEGDQILFERIVEKDSGQEWLAPYLVKKRVMLAGDVLSDARVSIGQFNEPYVSVTFDAKGAREFDRITGENVKKRMAIVLDNTIYSAPVIQERISGGRAQITGTFSMEEANNLSIVLRAGALPAPLKIIQDLTVGPSLGQDSIEKGVKATLFAGLLVIVFMALYYRLSGVIANFALLAEPDLSDRGARRPERHADPAGHCRYHSDDRYGCGLERVDFRAHPRRAAPGKGCSGCDRCGIRQGVADDRGLARDDVDHRVRPISLRYRADQRLCRDALPRYRDQPLYGAGRDQSGVRPVQSAQKN